jgi:aryl-phospho-beta-D-glucosidase BglC (GH1 family)
VHPSARDYAQVEDMGFNSVRFVIRGEWLAQDEEAFWTWLDRNVALAREAGVRLVIDLHVPVGGRWLDPGSAATTFEM